MKVIVRQATKTGKVECETPCLIDAYYPDSKTRRGRVQGSGKICPTIMTCSQRLILIRNECKQRKVDYCNTKYTSR